ncbi:XRE family transcriptional regulator [Streptomyces sp. NBC_01142]|uniref:XRE family transcriptional regulator n=1 Tax=Streptomyces sp. NBC_01142 TaxID=2975865 RepID=UPI00225778A1|nr:XRE family transcriptional regulator [Streptomyces sp. NBC_01142]MCX4826391.1 XRE family transcriptional regulator [Streptomyces sp. NBC_01142]
MDEPNRHPLAHARADRGMTGVDLAREVRAAALRRGLRSGVDKQRVRKWEVHGVTPDRDSQTYIAEALGIPADAVDPGDWPNWLPRTRIDGGVIPLGPASTVPALREALSTAMESRRTFLAISGTALTALAATWATSDTHALAQAQMGKPVGDEVVELLEDTSAKLAGLATEQRQHTAPLLDAHLSTVTDLIANGRYSPAIGLRLHTLAARLAQTVAWHRFDLGHHPVAAKYWVAGLHSAHASGDHDMGAGLLGDLAYQASWRKDSKTASGILEHALTRTEHPAARSLLQLRLARAHAAKGEKRAALRALDAAEHFLGTASGRPVPAWCSWLSEADLAVDSGQCLLDLGDTARAHQLIGEGQGLLPAARNKTRGVFLAYRADSHLNLGEPELAAAAARESLELAQRIGAPRCVQLVEDLLPRFRHYSAAQGVPELLVMAAA